MKTPTKIRSAASTLGKLGGKVAMQRLTAEQRQERSRNGGKASWSRLSPAQRRKRIKAFLQRIGQGRASWWDGLTKRERVAWTARMRKAKAEKRKES